MTITMKEVIERRKAEMTAWANTHVDSNKQWRVTAYPYLRKISVEVYSPITNKWYNVHTENM